MHKFFFNIYNNIYYIIYTLYIIILLYIEFVHEVGKKGYHYIRMHSQRNIKTYVCFSLMFHVETLTIAIDCQQYAKYLKIS